MSFGCREHTRSEAMRAAVAEAGRGLPAIEPGMPLPAGTGLSRRSFLLRSAGLAVAVYGAQNLSGHGIADAMAEFADDRILVSVYLEGGLDGLSVLAPVGEERESPAPDADPVREPHLGERRQGGADRAELASLEVDPERPAERGEAGEHVRERIEERHHGVEAEAADERVRRDLLEERRMRRDGDDGRDALAGRAVRHRPPARKDARQTVSVAWQ